MEPHRGIADLAWCETGYLEPKYEKWHSALKSRIHHETHIWLVNFLDQYPSSLSVHKRLRRALGSSNGGSKQFAVVNKSSGLPIQGNELQGAYYNQSAGENGQQQREASESPGKL